jgi:hypothetical protein
MARLVERDKKVQPEAKVNVVSEPTAGDDFIPIIEAEGYQNCLDAGVPRGVLLHPAAKQFKFSRVLREVEEPEATEHNPQNRPERIDESIGPAPQKKCKRHVPDQHREQSSRAQAAGRSKQVALAKNPHQDQDKDQRKRRHECGEHCGVKWVERLRPDCTKCHDQFLAPGKAWRLA